MNAVLGVAAPGRRADAGDDETVVFDGMVGRSPSMLQVFDLIRSAAASESPVLILGETGTGKELVARSIHQRSRRSRGPFVPVNCPAVPPSLFESEFFGHERGAFTGADAVRHGHFESAAGGTIFLDEIGDLSLEVQAKLLRVIDYREFVRVGSSQPRRADARIVAATNVDLREAVHRHAFREDLYWRLRALAIQLPPVRDRGEDIDRLLDAVLARIIRIEGLRAASLSSDARAVLRTHPWPGNVREIEATLREAIRLAGGGTIDGVHINVAPDQRQASAAAPPEISDTLPEGVTMPAWLRTESARVEKRLIEQALRSCGGVQTLAAARLGLDPRTLYTKMRVYRIPCAPTRRVGS